jgi:hypothetical protein
MNSRRFQLVAMLALVATMAWIYYDHDVSKRIMRDANALVAEASAMSELAKQKNEALEALSTDETIKGNRAALEAAARESTGRMVDRTENDTAKRICRMRRDSLASMADASEAAADGSAVWLDSKIVDQRSGFAAMEPHVQRAEAARERADNLKADAKALENAYRAGR